MGTHSPDARRDDRGDRHHLEPHNGAHLAADYLRAGFNKRGGRVLLSRTRRVAASGRQETAPVQHPVWPAHFCAAAIRRHRLSWTAGKLATEGKIMKVRNRN